MLTAIVSMSEWKNEEEIKAELRAMTGELRKLREGLRSMLSPPPKSNPQRAFLHRQSWPDPIELAPAVTTDRKRRRRAKKAR